MLLLRKRRLVLEPCINITLVELGLHFVFIMKKILLLESVHFGNTSHKREICLTQKARYVLTPPKPDVKGLYVKEIQGKLLGDAEARSELITAFKKLRGSVAKPTCRKAVCRIAARRLLNKALQMHREYASSLLKSIKCIKSVQINGREDFGKGSHTMVTEPYFYDSSYQLVKRETPIPINETGQCVVANEIEPEESSRTIKMWECSIECTQVTDAEVAAIVSLRAAFDAPMQELRHALYRNL